MLVLLTFGFGHQKRYNIWQQLILVGSSVWKGILSQQVCSTIYARQLTLHTYLLERDAKPYRLCPSFLHIFLIFFVNYMGPVPYSWLLRLLYVFSSMTGTYPHFFMASKLKKGNLVWTVPSDYVSHRIMCPECLLEYFGKDDVDDGQILVFIKPWNDQKTNLAVLQLLNLTVPLHSTVYSAQIL